MFKFNTKLSAYLLLIALTFALTACSTNRVKETDNPRNEITIAQKLVEFVNEGQIERASALFEDTAILIKENPCLEFFDETSGYSYRQLAYGEVLTIQGKAAIKSYLQNLLDSHIQITQSQLWDTGDVLRWQTSILLDHTSIQADFQAVIDIENGKIKTLVIAYADLVNL